jgi:hypothetical protein
MISEFESRRKEVPHFYTPFQHFSGVAKESHEKNSRIAGFQVEIQTRDHPNAVQEWYTVYFYVRWSAGNFSS